MNGLQQRIEDCIRGHIAQDVDADSAITQAALELAKRFGPYLLWSASPETMHKATRETIDECPECLADFNCSTDELREIVSHAIGFYMAKLRAGVQAELSAQQLDERRLVLRSWLETEFRAALDDEKLMLENFFAVVKVGRDKGEDPLQSARVALSSFVGELIAPELGKGSGLNDWKNRN